MKKILFFDTETTGLPKSWGAPASDTENWPRLVQLGWILADTAGNIIHQGNMIIKPDGFEIPEPAARVHGITTEIALAQGKPLHCATTSFAMDLAQADAIVGHNVTFDVKVVGAELFRMLLDFVFERMDGMPRIDTMLSSTDYCKIRGANGRVKWPKLIELYQFLFNKPFDNAHDAMADITATMECYYELVNRGVLASLNE